MAVTELIEVPEDHTFYLVDDGVRIARIVYERDGDVYDLQHTIVDPDVRRKGVGAELVELVLAHLRSIGACFIPTCPYIRHWLDTHHAYDDLIVD